MTFYEAAVEVLREAGRPLHFKKITEISLKRSLLSHVGRTPESTMRARLMQESAKEGDASVIYALRSGVFTLREGADLTTVKQTIQLKQPAATKAEDKQREAAAKKVMKDAQPEPLVQRDVVAGEVPAVAQATEVADAPTVAETVDVVVPAPADAPAEVVGSEAREGRSRRRSRRRRSDADGVRMVQAPSVMTPTQAPTVDQRAEDEEAPTREESGRRRRRGRRGGRGRAEGTREVTASTAVVADNKLTSDEIDTGSHDHVSLGEVATVVSGGGELARVILEALRDAKRSMNLNRLAERVSAKGFGSAKRLGPGAIRGALEHANRRQMANGRPPLFVESRPNAWRIAMASGAELAKSYLALDRWQTTHRAVLQRTLVNRLEALDAASLCTVVTLLIERLDYNEIQSHPAIGDEVSTLAGCAPRGLTSARVAVRVANPSREMTREDVMAFRGSLHIYGASEGVIVAAGGVSEGAREEGVVPNLPRISILNREELADMMIVSGVGVSRFRVEVSYLDEAFFRDYERDERR